MAHIKEFKHLKIRLEAIKSATNNFADDYCIGVGGFGKVYKGEIDHHKGQKTLVAFKRLDRYCDDYGEKILVYEYASKKSLDLYLKNAELTWVERLKICIGAARGLAYLHTPGETQLRVLHRDIKSSNILLDENWNSKISDFGLSKFGPANQQFTYLISDAVGTQGYCDPLYAETGLLTKESDVYSFGVVLFEVFCGRLCFGNINDKQRPLIGLVREYYEKNNISELTFVNMKGEIDPDSLKAFTEIAYQCIHKERKDRPLMKHIVGKLENSLYYQEEKSKATADAKAHAEAKLKAVTQAKEMAVAEEKAKAKAKSEAKAESDAKAKAVAQEYATRVAEAKARIEAREKAKADAKANPEPKAMTAAEVKAMAESKANEMKVARAKAESNALERVAARAKAKAEAEIIAESEAKLRSESEAKARVLAEAKAKAMADEKARVVLEDKGRAKAKKKAEAMEKGAGILNVKVLRITGIERSRELFNVSNPYLILEQTFSGGMINNIMKTSVKHNESDPEWNEEFSLYVENFNEEALHIQVINAISKKTHDYVGETWLSLKSLTPEISRNFVLIIKDVSSGKVGKIMIESVYKPFTYDEILSKLEDLNAVQKAPIGTPQGGGLLVVIIHRASLKAKEGHPHAYVSLLFRGQLRKTVTMMNTREPVWEQEFIFMLEQPPRNEEKLHFEVVNNKNNNSLMRLIPGKKYMGRVDKRIADLVSRKRTMETLVFDSYNTLDVELQWRTSN